MKKTVMLITLLMVPLFAINNSDDNFETVRPVVLQGQDSPIDPAYVAPAQVSIGRGLGDVLMTIDVLPFGCDGPSGLSWDGQYLYIAALLSDSVYVIDPTGPTLINAFPSPPTSSFGAGMEQNLWITCITTDSAYEFTTAGTPTGNQFFCAVGGHSWTAGGTEWWPDGEIWFTNVGTSAGNKVYKYAVPSGAVLDSLTDPTYTYTSQRGMSYDPWNDKLWIGGWNSDSVWELNSDGTPTGRRFYMDGVAGIAYDWQSTLHPTPVLWICLQTPDQVVMVDADNPNPVAFTYFWDFEDGWQDWTHTNGGSFPAAWDVVESGYTVGSYTIAPPDAGDSSFCIDGDSGGVCHDTAMSPVVDNPGFTWFKWGMHFQNYVSYQTFYVIMRTFSTGAWNPWDTVWVYTSDTDPQYDSVDISGIVDDSIQVGFVYDQPHATLAWFAAFDNVELVQPVGHDVGCNMITSPPAGDLIPAGNYDVIGNIVNFGSSAETFDATAEVWDTTTWTQIFTQSATFTDFAAGAESLHTFGNVTFETEKVYYTVIYTELVDDDPSNDTSFIYSSTIIPTYYWEILDPPTFPLPSAGHSEATMHDGYYYVFGLLEGSVYSDTFIIYDIAGNQWLDGGTNPYGASRYGTANHVNGRFYVLGGTAAWPTPNQWIGILEPPNTWTAGATPPIAMMDQMTGVYKDSLLFVFGAGEWSMTPITDVYFYDTYTDAWTTCTSFPDPGRGAMAGGVIDSFAVLAFGYTVASNYDNNYCVGIIDETDPSSITWGSWAPVPGGAIGVRRVPSGVDEFNGELWVIGGQISGGQLDRTLSYDPYTDTWTDWNTPKPQPICNLTPIPVTTTTMGDLGVFCGGGYTSGYIDDHEVFHTGNYTGIAENPGQESASLRFGFAPSMPNPTKSYAAISYTTTTSGPVSVRMYDATGRLVKTLVDRVIEPAGTKTVYWNGKDDAHRDISNGIYFLRLEAEGKVDTHKMIFVR